MFARLIKLLSIGALIICNTFLAQYSNDSLNTMFAEIYSESNFPGFAVAIVKNEKILYQNGLGYADLENKIPFSVNTIQNIASISKTFIGVAIMKAIEQDYLTLDAPINEILPFKTVNPYFPDAQITIRHLATHTSGIKDLDPYYHELAYTRGKAPGMKLGVYLNNYLSPEGE